MPAFAYVGVSPAGQRTKGELQAGSEALALRILEQRGLFVTRLVAVREDTAVRLRPRRAELLAFTRAFSSLLTAGLPLSRVLDLVQHACKGDFGTVVRAVRSRVDRGEALAAALAEYPQHFPTVYVGLIRAGERTGDLAGVTRRLYQHLEQEAEFRSRVLAAAIYPILLAGAGSAAILLLLFFVLPRFAELVQDSGAKLPASTAAMLALAAVLQRIWPFLLLLFVAGLLGLASAQFSKNAAERTAVIVLRTPLIGAFRRNALSARFARLLGILLGGGAPVLAALDDVTSGLGDPMARRHVGEVRDAVRQGRPIHVALKQTGFFSPIVGELVALGEETGQLEDLLNKGADILEREVQGSLQRITAFAEPIIIVGFGLVVGGIALSLLQAVYGINAGALR